MRRTLRHLNAFALGLSFVIPFAALDAYGAWGLALGVITWPFIVAAIGHNLAYLKTPPTDPKEPTT